MAFVSGPTNIVRLENENQTIYLLGEFHSNLTTQKECPISSDSLRIDQLLKKTFQKNKSDFNLFVETQKDWIYNYKNANGRTSTYIDVLRTLFSDNVSFTSNDKIQPSKSFPNVKFHYFDIRYGDLEYLYDYTEISLHTASTKISFLKTITKSILSKSNKYIKKTLEKKFHDKELQNAITEVYNQIIDEVTSLNKRLEKLDITKLYDSIDKNKYKLDLFEIEEKFINPFITELKKINKYIEMIGVMYNDLYLLKKLLNNNKTKVNYVYCGNAHLINIALFLQKYTTFKITHTNETNKVLSTVYKKYSAKYFITKEAILTNNITGTCNYFDSVSVSQCTDLSCFPSDFL